MEFSQGDVPALPEVDHSGCLVGAIKINWQRNIEHPADAYGHVTIATKVEVEAERYRISSSTRQG